MSLSHSPSIVRDGLVGYWDSGNVKSYPGTGTTWTDLSGNALHGTVFASPVYSNGTFSFDSTSSQYVRVSYDARLAPSAGLTLTTWAHAANWLAKTGDERFFSCTQTGGWHLGINDGSYPLRAGVIVYMAGAYRTASYLRSNLSPGWHMFSGTSDGRYVRFYVDGVMVSQYDHGSTVPITYTTNNARIIAGEAGTGSSPTAGNYYTGMISIVSIYDTALTAEQVYQNFSAHRGRFGL